MCYLILKLVMVSSNAVWWVVGVFSHRNQTTYLRVRTKSETLATCIEAEIRYDPSSLSQLVEHSTHLLAGCWRTCAGASRPCAAPSCPGRCRRCGRSWCGPWGSRVAGGTRVRACDVSACCSLCCPLTSSPRSRPSCLRLSSCANTLTRAPAPAPLTSS